MASYRIEWKHSAVKDLRRLPTSDLARILTSVKSLADNPFPPGSIKLFGSERSYRIRVGDYRILYDVFGERLTIEVIKVGHRKDVYRD